MYIIIIGRAIKHLPNRTRFEMNYHVRDEDCNLIDTIYAKSLAEAIKKAKQWHGWNVSVTPAPKLMGAR